MHFISPVYCRMLSDQSKQWKGLSTQLKCWLVNYRQWRQGGIAAVVFIPDRPLSFENWIQLQIKDGLRTVKTSNETVLFLQSKINCWNSQIVFEVVLKMFWPLLASRSILKSDTQSVTVSRNILVGIGENCRFWFCVESLQGKAR